MTIIPLKEIQVVLTALSKKPSTLGYLWAKNLNLVKGIITKSDEDLTAAKAPLYEKDEEGKDIQFVAKYIESTVMAEILFDENGEKRRLKADEKLVFPYVQATTIATENLDKLNEIQKQYFEEEHEVKWVTVPEAKFVTVAEAEKIEGELIVPIDGIIIISKETKAE